MKVKITSEIIDDGGKVVERRTSEVAVAEPQKKPKNIIKEIWNDLKGIPSKLWSLRFDTQLSINCFLIMFTDLIMVLYCYICLIGVTDLQQKFQFWIDAFFSSTLTLALSVLMQNFVEITKNKKADWSFTAILLALSLTYAMACAGIRETVGICLFIVFAIYTCVLDIVCLISIGQIRYTLKREDSKDINSSEP